MSETTADELLMVLVEKLRDEGRDPVTAVILMLDEADMLKGWASVLRLGAAGAWKRATVEWQADE